MPTIWQYIFVKNCMEMKEITPRGGHTVPSVPFDPPLNIFSFIVYFIILNSSKVNRVNEIKKSTFATIVASESLWTQADSSPSHVPPFSHGCLPQ